MRNSPKGGPHLANGEVMAWKKSPLIDRRRWWRVLTARPYVNSPLSHLMRFLFPDYDLAPHRWAVPLAG